MSQCGSCQHANEPGAAFCLNCGAALQAGAPAQVAAPRASTVGGLERGVFFKVARVVAWVVAVVAALGMVFSLVLLVPALSDLNAGPKEVTGKDVKAAIEQAKTGGNMPLGQLDPFANASAEELGELDIAIYKLRETLRAEDAARFGDSDGFRSWVKGQLNNAGPGDLAEREELVGSAREVVVKLPAEDRVNGIQFYFQLVGQHRVEAEATKAKGSAAALTFAGGLASCAITLMMITMTLVLLAIERNTRGHAE